MKIAQLVRPNILSLKPYSSARDEYQGTEGVFLDANENPYGALNRYPDPYQAILKQAIANEKNLSVNQIMIGNGSDEIIDLAIRIFCEPGKDKVLVCSPTYGMYRITADINNVEVVDIPLSEDFQLNTQLLLDVAESENIRIVFLCSPNNPTGNLLKDIDTVLRRFKGIVFVDEAYIDFSSQKSLVEKLDEFPNLIVSQTFSKARGLANARVGMAFADPEIIEFFNRVKPPYNVSGINQRAAVDALKDREGFQRNLYSILNERKRVIEALKELRVIKKIFPTEANFVLVQCTHADDVYQRLIEKKVIVRNRSTQTPDTLRISIGTPEENRLLIKTLKEI